MSTGSRTAFRKWTHGLVALLMVAAVAVAPPPAESADRGEVPDGGAAVESVSRTSVGTEFWLAFQENLDFLEPPPPTLKIFVAAAEPGSGTVSVPGIAFSEDFTVTPGEVTTIDVPTAAALSGSDSVQDRGVRVVADTEIAVYGLNQMAFTTDAFLGLPVTTLGHEYIVLAHENSVFDGTQFAVVATEDDTTVTITPSVTTSGRTAGEPYDVTLDEGQGYQLQNVDDEADLSGSFISADKPVAAFGGHICGNVPAGVSFCDHMVQQLLPTSAWGSSFVTMPFIDREGDTFRIISATDGTAISIDDEEVATLDRGEFHETILDEPAQIVASHPVMVSQYMHGSQYDAEDFGDPSVVPIAPAEQYLAHYTVTTPAEGFVEHAINLVVPDDAVGAVTIDGEAVPAEDYVAIGDTGFSGAQVRVDAGSKVLSGPLPFAATMYGMNQDDSYAYPGGMSLSPVALVDTVTVEPATATHEIGTEQCATATVSDADGGALTGIRVDFSVAGTHAASGFVFTDGNGEADFCYTGTDAGDDTIAAVVGPHAASAAWTWQVSAPPPDPDDGIIHSFWMFGPIRVIDESGEVVDVLEELIEAVSDELGPEVELIEGVGFREAPPLAPELVGEDGEVRDDIELTGGVLTSEHMPGGGAIMVVATPKAGGGVSTPGGRHSLRSGDSVRLDLSSIGGSVPPGSTVVGSPGYGEAMPDPDDPGADADTDPIESLVDRFADHADPETDAERIGVAGGEDAGGTVVVAAVPGMVGTAVEGPGESVLVHLPAVSRMLDHFLSGAAGPDPFMTSLTAIALPGVAGALLSPLAVIETFVILHLAVKEMTEFLSHMTSGGSPDTFGETGHSWGDPHLRTFDGRNYDFQAAGEFVAARTDGFEVQLRMVPWEDTPISRNHVAAVRVGDDTIIVRGGIDSPVIINGEEFPQDVLFGDGVDLEGGTATRHERMIDITTDDGHQVSITCGRVCDYVDVFVFPDELGVGGWEGLFGTNDGDVSNDFQTRDGDVFEWPISFDDLYGDFAEAWRVSDEESLFDYGPGEDTETFTDRSFPGEVVTVDTLPEADRVVAEAVCREAGLGDHNQRTLDECIIDFAITGDLCFVESAQLLGIDLENPGGHLLPTCPFPVFIDVGADHPHFGTVCQAWTAGILVGFPDATFGPHRLTTRGQMASFVARALEVSGYDLPEASDQGFTDVADSVHAGTINQLVEAGIIHGVAPGRFEPRASVTRAQMMSYLIGAAEWALDVDLAAEDGPHFTDTAGNVHEGSIDAAFELGLTTGLEPGIFGPSAATTRGQSATFLAGLLEVVGTGAD